MDKYVLGIGIATVDLIGQVPSFPEPDGFTFMQEFDRQIGGPVANALTALTRLGERTMWAGKVGSDEFGRWIIDDLDAEGVLQNVMVDQSGSTPLSFILVDIGTGCRSIIFHPGCALMLEQELTQACLSGAKLIHLDGGFIDAAFQAASYGKENGVRVALDAGVYFPGLDEILDRIDIFMPTLGIARMLTGEDNVEDCLKKLQEAGPRSVIVTDGKAGSWARENSLSAHAPAVSVDVVDTTGCGDAFHGAYLFGELRGWQLSQKLLFANAYAALKATRLGGRKGLPTTVEIKEFIQDRALPIPKL
jgi:ribokinase